MNDKTALFDWYLARLRRLALTEQVRQQATPSALVGADAAAVKKRIEVELRERFIEPADIKANLSQTNITGSRLYSLLAAVLIAGALFFA